MQMMIILLAESSNYLKQLPWKVQEGSTKAGLYLNIKTKNTMTTEESNVDSDEPEVVKGFLFLGTYAVMISARLIHSTVFLVTMH